MGSVATSGQKCLQNGISKSVVTEGSLVIGLNRATHLLHEVLPAELVEDVSEKASKSLKVLIKQGLWGSHFCSNYSCILQILEQSPPKLEAMVLNSTCLRRLVQQQ